MRSVASPSSAYPAVANRLKNRLANRAVPAQTHGELLQVSFTTNDETFMAARSFRSLAVRLLALAALVISLLPARTLTAAEPDKPANSSPRPLTLPSPARGEGSIKSPNNNSARDNSAKSNQPAQKTLRVASCSIFPTKWDKPGNADKVEKVVRDAAAKGAQLVITPEGVLEGYVINEVNHEKDPAKKAQITQKFHETAEPIDGPYITRFRKLADELNIHLIVGFLERDGEKMYNTAALLGPEGQLVGRYHKTHFAQGYDGNPPGYMPGDEYPVFDIGSLKVGMMICFDRQVPEAARQLALNGADLIACPSYGSKGDWNTRLMQVRAYENQAWVTFTHPEQSLIIDNNGKLLDEVATDQFVIREIDLTHLEKKRVAIKNRRPQTYKKLSDTP
jgi:predicted amidohydrolase